MRNYNIKKGDTKELNNILMSLNQFQDVRFIPTTIFDSLRSKLDNIKTTKKQENSYYEIVNLIQNQHKTNARLFQRVYYKYDIILNNLLNWDIITLTKDYENIYNGNLDNVWSNSSPRVFDIKPKVDDNITLLILDNIDSKLEVNYDINIDINKKEEETLKYTTIDWREAIEGEYKHLKTKNLTEEEFSSSFCSRVAKIFKFMSYRRIDIGDKVDRIYSSFTLLTSISRDYLNINGNYFVSSDLKNAQPTLIVYASMIDEYIIDDSYIKNTQEGNFYESIMKEAKKMGIKFDKIRDKESKKEEMFLFESRDDVKILCYRTIFFYQNKNSNCYKIFKKLYPKTTIAIEEMAKQYNSTASKLQNTEAEIFHKTCNFSHYTNGHYFIVHDAIYYTNTNDRFRIENRLREVLRDKGVESTISFEENNRHNYIIDKKKKVIELLNQDYSLKDVATITGYSKSMINKIKKKLVTSK